MIAEDDEILLRALYLLLHNAGYTIASATNGEEALKMTERLKPNLVLLDLLMPKLDGFGYLERVKAHSELKNIPIIVLSNLDGDDSLAKVKKFGVTDYFVKANTDLAVLAKKVKEVLS